MFFRIVIICLFLAACYAGWQIVSVRMFYHGLQSSPADFTVINDGNKTDVTIVEFMNYDCGFCKDTHLVLLDYAEKNKTAKLVVRPVPFANDGAETAAEMALAAGLQGKFWELDRAMAEFVGPLDEKFFREAAAVFDIDFDRMVREAEEETVQKMAGRNADDTLRAGFKTVPAFMIGRTAYQLERALTPVELDRMVREETAR